jgi:hypothetical protein
MAIYILSILRPDSQLSVSTCVTFMSFLPRCHLVDRDLLKLSILLNSCQYSHVFPKILENGHNKLENFNVIIL